jgi:hypothetical protein
MNGHENPPDNGRRYARYRGVDGASAQYGLTEPVEICWKDRRTSQEAVVLPEAKNILLGALPLEGMDLMVDPVNQRLVGVHGDQRIYLVY